MNEWKKMFYSTWQLRSMSRFGYILAAFEISKFDIFTKSKFWELKSV